jgi:hypothetical protein
MAITKRYRETGGDIFEIRYEQQPDGTWKMFADEHPDNSFDTSVVKCHLYGSGQICVASGKEPRSFDRARAIAIAWMDGYSQYVRTGSFPTGRKRVNV